MKYISEYKSAQPHVVVVELRRPPFNYLNVETLAELADTLERLDADTDCRAIVLASEGRAFSAGADFSPNGGDTARNTETFYTHEVRLFRATKPVVAAVEGAAVGAGLGLAVAADFRVTCREARFSANFNRLGFHPGFGLSVTLPRLIGAQQASLLFYSGRRLDGEQAHKIGLADVLVDQSAVRETAVTLAAEIAVSAPLAVQATRATLRAGLADQIQTINRRELEMQLQHYATEDFREGIAAMAERRPPNFNGR